MICEYWEDVLDCWAILWRIDLTQAVEQLTFEATWTPSVSTYEGGFDSGQGLEAQTWNTATMTLSLGTEGEDDLYARATSNDRLPQRFLDQSPDSYTLPFVQYQARGFAITYTELQAGEQLQAQFIVAWAPYIDEAIATWSAVNLLAEHILRGAMARGAARA